MEISEVIARAATDAKFACALLEGMKSLPLASAWQFSEDGQEAVRYRVSGPHAERGMVAQVCFEAMFDGGAPCGAKIVYIDGFRRWEIPCENGNPYPTAKEIRPDMERAMAESDKISAAAGWLLP